MSRSEYTYTPAWWVPGRHLQTLWGKLFRRSVPLRTCVDVLRTPDGDELELHHLEARPGRPHVVLLHGLEGTTRSHYVGGIVEQARRRGWGAHLLLFRGCGSRPNSARRFYHSGETTDVALAMEYILGRYPDAQFAMVGVSLGGNVLLKWLGELGARAPERLRAAAAISVPFDLERGARHISQGFSRVYEANFVGSLKRKAAAKLARYPDLFDEAALRRARTIFEFDDVVTAPVHGFRDARDYYARSSALAWLQGIRRPTLLLSAADDPFLPAEVLDQVRVVAHENPFLHTEFTRKGGHVGFVSGRVPWRPHYYAEWRALEFLAAALADA